MVKPSKPRKTRLDIKDGGSSSTPTAAASADFIGFGAFASTTTTTTTTWSPVYTGKNEQFGALFPRLFQKRDAVTVTKCLLELDRLFMNEGDIPSKRDQVEALWHYAWLYHSKLSMSNASSVRAAAATIWKTAYARIPKAVGTVVTQYPELLGILYAATQTDASSEVRAVDINSLLLQQQWPWQTGLLAYTSRMLNYGRASVLHEALFATKQQQRSTSNKSSTQESADKKNEQNHHQEDVMEERFERLIGNCLDALSMWIRHHGGDITIPHETSSVWWKTLQSPKPSLRRKTYQLLLTIVTTTVNNNNNTAAAGQQFLLPTNLDTILPQVVATEKEAVNIPILLETVLAVLAAAVHGQAQQKNNNTASLMVKPLGKVLKKACYGAKVELWGPVLLPLVAQLDDAGDKNAQQLLLLQAAYDGLSVALGGESDRYQLLTAIAESASFLLLRRRRRPTKEESPSNTDTDDNSPTTIAQLWLRVLTDALSTTTSTNSKNNNNKTGTPASMAREKLLHDLAKQLLQFDEAASSSSSCAFRLIADWFWDDLDLANNSSIQPYTLARLLQKLQHLAENRAATERTTISQETNSSSIRRNCGGHGYCSRLVPKLRQQMRHVLNQYQQSSGAVPTEDVYQLMQAVLDYCGPLAVFEQQQQQQDDGSTTTTTTLEKFIMNDLLRWTVIHTSTLSTTATIGSSSQQVPQSKTVRLPVEQDFGLLSTCLAALVDKRHLLWESFLREIIAAKCHLEYLSAGLRTLVQRNGKEIVGWVVCETLDNFAVQLAHPTTYEESTLLRAPDIVDDESFDTATEDAGYDKRLDFFCVCMGSDSESSPTLVGDRVLFTWIEYACPSQGSDDIKTSHEIIPVRSVLEVLLQVAQKKRSMLSNEHVDRILTESWRRPDRLYEVYTSSMLSSDSSLRDHFVMITSQELRQDLTRYVAKGCSTDETKAWSMRTWRILRASIDSDQIFPSLPIGTEDIDLWQKNPEAMFDLSMTLFQNIKNPSDRLALVKSWGDSDPSFLCSLLISLSEASSDPVAATRAKDRRDRCALFLAAIGGKSLDTDFVEDTVRAVISRLGSVLKDREASLDGTIRCGTAVLSQLVDLLFYRVLPSGATELAPEDVLEGARLWYVVDAKEPSVREEATVVKVHYDSQAGYYYTIQVQRDGVAQERQTVLDRLRKDQDSDSFGDSISEDDIPREEWAKRSDLRNLVLRNLILPFFSRDDRLESMGELVNIVVCQLGVGKDRGLGSPHYDIHRCVSALEERLRTALVKQETQTTADRLWMLSLTLGFGLNTPPSKWTMQQIRIDPIPSYRNLLVYYSDESIGAQPQLDCAVLSWLIVSFTTALEYQEEAGDAVFRSLILLFNIAGQVLEQDRDAGLSMIACRAVYEGMMLSTQRWCQQMPSQETLGLQLFQAKEKALSNLIKAFAANQESETLLNEDSVATYYSDFSQLVTASLQNQSILECLASASARHVNSLTRALYDPTKRNLAFMVIDSIASRGTPLHAAEDKVPLSDQTSRRLKAWTDGLEEEEAAELEEDIHIVAGWVPANMMNELENWAEEEFEEFDESTIIGRLMIWLSFLRFIDAAAPRDFRNRPAFVSYLGKCGAVSPILTLGILHDEAINDPKRKPAPSFFQMGDFWKKESVLHMTELASLSLFRTVEVLPSLSRRWWEEECPKVYTNAVQLFVEKQVSPEILKRELDRIRSSTSFGPMTVTASLVSREVIATYVQDDFSLSVVISLPAAFPFRSAEVDCSKTLGVPQNRWKRWSLQIMLILNNQGGTLQDALMLWKDNVDKEFEGVEPCPVCYSVLHVKTHKLPSLECKTCKNRFHMDCLTQWFRSSGKSQCVLCQQPWQGSRIQ